MRPDTGLMMSRIFWDFMIWDYLYDNVEKEKAEMAELYQKLGTFGASFVLQNEINLSALDKMINEMILGAEHWSSETGKKVFELTDKLKVWYVKQYEPFLYGFAVIISRKGNLCHTENFLG